MDKAITYRQSYKNHLLQESERCGYNFRPGLGVTGNIRETKVISIRTYVQLGFNIPIDNALKPKNPLTFEFKVGIGINARQLKRDKQTIIETEQQDTN